MWVATVCYLLATGHGYITILSLCYNKGKYHYITIVQVVQEYERAVIFRLGRLLPGGAKGPGIFSVLPCIESYQKVDLRTITLGVPPQEVSSTEIEILIYIDQLYN